MIAVREYTSAAEMRANAMAVRPRLLGLGKPIKIEEKPRADALELRPGKLVVFTYRDEYPKDAHVVAYRQHMARQQCKAIPYLEARCIDMGIPVAEITGTSRIRGIVLPRQIIIWEIKRTVKPRISFSEIGRMFGGRDHTTVLHAVRKIDRLIAEGKLTVGDDGKIIYRRDAK